MIASTAQEAQRRSQPGGTLGKKKKEFCILRAVGQTFNIGGGETFCEKLEPAIPGNRPFRRISEKNGLEEREEEKGRNASLAKYTIMMSNHS